MEDYKWNLDELYSSQEEFLKDYEYCKNELIPSLLPLQGRLKTKKGLITYLDIEREINRHLSRLSMFASMRSDLDKRNVENSDDNTRVDLLFNMYLTTSSFVQPEMIKIGKPYFDNFLKENPEYSDFDFIFDQLFRQEKFILPEKQERQLSYFGNLQNSGSELYSQLAVADYKPNKVKLSNGEKVEVTTSNYTKLVMNADSQEDRKKIFESLYSYYDEHKSTFAQIYNSTLQGQLAEMKARGFESILQLHLYGNKIDESVFLNLIDVASSNAEPLHKYYEIRRKYLKLEKHRSYDRFTQLAKSDKKYTFEEAQKVFFDSIESFPEDFKKKAREVNKPGYIDVYNQPGKRTGAYSSGGEDIHPYILLNFNGELDDCFTLAHESGHSIHTLYSEEAQPLMKQNYTIFVAEIASTFNEHNLLDYLMKQTNLSKNDKISLLQKSIDEIVSTFYRQTLFANYEYDISKKAENGEPINHEVLSNEMVKLYKTYYGIDIAEEKLKPLVWAYIPHLFYTPFYVYQYATSFTASMHIYDNVKENKPKAFENYIKLLKSGGSTYPIDEVKQAGVDLTTKEPFLAVTKRMSELVDQLEELLFSK